MSLQSIALLGIVIIALLAGYALSLWLKVWHQQRERANSLQAQKLNQQGAAQGARDNIIIMLRVALQQQASLTEVAIRIMAYCRALPAEESGSIHYQPFDQLARKTAHIPILDKWQALSRQAQNKFDDERQTLEEDHREAIMKASQSLLESLQLSSDSINIREKT